KLDWQEQKEPEHAGWLRLYRELLALRKEKIASRLANAPGGEAEYRLVGERGLEARWRLGDGSRFSLLANLGDESLGGFEEPEEGPLYATGIPANGGELPAWSVAWYLLSNDE
nr:DUF3459 domain-containing protein [Rubrobacter sp.]